MEPLVTVHDRYLQLALYPFCAMLTFAILWLAEHRPWQWSGVALALVLMAAWSASTWHESGFWDNSMSLWGRAVQMAPHNINARVELARLNAVNDLPAAIHVLDDGLQQVPNSPGLWRTRGLLLFNAGRLQESRSSLLKALEVSARYANASQPEPTDVKYGRAAAAFYLGEIEMLEGRPAAADSWLRMALAIDPENSDYNTVMIANLKKQGLDDEAARLQQALHQRIAASRPRAR
jgi:tetratricopeptide (TPR) repeat protein